MSAFTYRNTALEELIPDQLTPDTWGIVLQYRASRKKQRYRINIPDANQPTIALHIFKIRGHPSYITFRYRMRNLSTDCLTTLRASTADITAIKSGMVIRLDGNDDQLFHIDWIPENLSEIKLSSILWSDPDRVFRTKWLADQT